MADPQPIAVGVLGNIEVVRAGQRVRLGGTKQRAVLALLAMNAGEIIAPERLADLLWDGAAPPSAPTTLRGYLSNLRKAIEPETATADTWILRTTPSGYVLDLPRDRIDATRFEDLASQGRALRSSDLGGAVDAWTDALALWRGDAYQDFGAFGFAVAEADRLHEMRAGCSEDLLEARLDRGEHESIVGEISRFVAAHPQRERAMRLQMLALYRCDRQSDALEAFDAGRRWAADELGADLSPESRRLHTLILRHDDALVSAPLAALIRTTSAGRSDARPRRPARGLPIQPTSFIGRLDLIEQIRTAVKAPGAVTLTGVGGVGKTRTAIEVGLRLADDYEDGVWLCELASVSDAVGMEHAVASALGAQPQPDQTIRASIVGALAQRRALVLLDNCEHVTEAAAALAAEILARCPTVDLLVTSRRPLGVDDEDVIDVPPLRPDSEAVALFLDRARATRADFSAHESIEGVLAICSHVDGIPLALELAATGVGSRSPADIADRLREGIDVLQGEGPSTGRHRSLEAALDWSFDRLSAPTQAVFDQLSVFRGGFTLEAAAAVTGVEPEEALAALESLTAASMVIGGSQRFMLLEPLRHYAADHLARTDDGGAFVRHGRWFVDLLGSLFGPETLRTGKAALITAADEFDNIRAAFTRAVDRADVDIALPLVASLSYLHAATGRREVAVWAETAVAMPGASEHDLFPAVLTIASDGAWRSGDLGRSRSAADEAFAAIDDPDDPRLAMVLAARAVAPMFEGDLAAATTDLAESARLARRHGLRIDELTARGTTVLTSSYAGDRGRASQLAEELRTDMGDEGPAADALTTWWLGEAVWMGGEDPDRALELLEEARGSLLDFGMTFQAGLALVSEMSIRARHGDPRAALERSEEALEHWRRSGNWMQQWTTIRNLAELLGRVGALADAVALVGAADVAATASPTYGDEAARIEELIGRAQRELGPDGFAAADEEGRSLSGDEAVALAREAIGRAIRTDPF